MTNKSRTFTIGICMENSGRTTGQEGGPEFLLFSRPDYAFKTAEFLS